MLEIQQTGERTLRFSFPPKIDTDTHLQVVRLRTLALTIYGVLEAVPGYHTLTLFLIHERSIGFIKQQILALWNKADSEITYQGVLHEIPVIYKGMDLEQFAQAKNVSVQQVIELHTSVEYTVNMIGFLPGFPYLSGLHERLHIPRLATPRRSVPKGSIGIGGSQTGIYPIDSPGGWHLIGHTHVPIFSPTKENPFLFSVGDRIRFVEISEHDFQNHTGGGESDQPN